jgi:hypothetical protein
MIYAMWFGGTGYAHGDLVEDLESFPSLAAAKAALVERRDRGYGFMQDFEFVNQKPVSCYCPCVEDDSSMWVWLAADEDDGKVYVPEYPDRVIEFGPRGGVVVTAA